MHLVGESRANGMSYDLAIFEIPLSMISLAYSFLLPSPAEIYGPRNDSVA